MTSQIDALYESNGVKTAGVLTYKSCVTFGDIGGFEDGPALRFLVAGLKTSLPYE